MWRQTPPADLLHGLGITRIGDITDLDVIGVPVWTAVRPNARTLSVSTGKGQTSVDARIGAIMEAAEAGACENARAQVDLVAPLAELEGQGISTVPLDKISRCRFEYFDPHRERAWVKGYSLTSGRDTLAPYELVGMDYRSPSHWDQAAFVMSSGGLGAAFDEERALRHALMECIEDDAIALSDFTMSSRPVEASELLLQALGDAYSMVFSAGFDVEFSYLPSPTGIPVIRCDLLPDRERHRSPFFLPSAGFGTETCAFHAAKAAILEAIQSRVTDIAAARDDIQNSDYKQSRASPVNAQIALNSRMKLDELKGQKFCNSIDIVNIIMKNCNIEDIYHFPLVSNNRLISVSRVLMTGFADKVGDECFIPFRRLFN